MNSTRRGWLKGLLGAVAGAALAPLEKVAPLTAQRVKSRFIKIFAYECIGVTVANMRGVKKVTFSA